jgi:hypothetical protein
VRSALERATPRFRVEDPPIEAEYSGAQNAVVAWHAVMESSVAGSGRNNAVALPYYAYVDVAMYDAVTAIDRRFQPFAVRVDAANGASEDAAAASAARDVLVHYFPSQAGYARCRPGEFLGQRC